MVILVTGLSPPVPALRGRYVHISGRYNNTCNGRKYPLLFWLSASAVGQEECQSFKGLENEMVAAYHK